jgi:hypothetical protein
VSYPGIFTEVWKGWERNAGQRRGDKEIKVRKDKGKERSGRKMKM